MIDFSEQQNFEIEIDESVGENSIVTNTEIIQTSRVGSSKSKSFNLYQHILNTLGDSMAGIGASSKTNIMSHTNITVRVYPISSNTVTTITSSRSITDIDSSN